MDKFWFSHCGRATWTKLSGLKRFRTLTHPVIPSFMAILRKSIQAVNSLALEEQEVSEDQVA